jgi:RimJ/RimL family protein N-acetyltransferase
MSDSKYFLTTNRLGFRNWKVEDIELAIGLWGDYEVTKLFESRGPLSHEQVQTRLCTEIASQNEHGIQYWPIFHLKTDEHIGCAGLRPYDLAGNIVEIGFHIRSTSWRQGFALEAALEVISFAFYNKAFSSIFAGHNPENSASRKLLLKLGFKYTHDEFYQPTGLQHPSYLLTKDQYSNIINSVANSNVH